jgi:hypothetical protein
LGLLYTWPTTTLVRRETAQSTVGAPATGSRPARISRSTVSWKMAMTTIETEASDYLEWMEIHNYARLEQVGHDTQTRQYQAPGNRAPPPVPFDEDDFRD